MSALDLSGYKLTFDDEFNGFSWNSQSSNAYRTRTPTGTWSTSFWWGNGERNLVGNAEVQYYSDPSVGTNPFTISNGTLKITTAASANPAATRNFPYTSGVITSEGTFSQKYGYFEIRAKLPAGQGMWPQFWLIAQDHSWPPEIDTLEAFGSDPHSFHWALHSGRPNSGAGDWVEVLPNLTNSFHTYGVMWTAETLTYYFDGAPVAQAATPADMHKPMYMVANLAVGGSWAGNPFPYTALPASLSIDYIRAYSNDPAAVAAPPQPVSAPDAIQQPTVAAAPHSATPVASQPFSNILASGIFSGTSGNDLLRNAYGDTAARAGKGGDDTYFASDPRLPILEQEGQGVDTILAWVNYSLPPNVENLQIDANYGLHGYGNELPNLLTGGGGDDWLDAGGGDDLLTGRGGSDTFFVLAGNGYDTIADFQAGDGTVHDRLVLDGYGFADAAAVQRALKQVGADTVLTLDNGETVTFRALDARTLTAGNFALANVSAGFGATPITDPAALPALYGQPGVWGQDASIRTGTASYGEQTYQVARVASAWGTVQAVQVDPATWPATPPAHLAYDNFVRTDLDLRAAGTASLDLMVVAAKHGTIVVGSGDDHITWVAHSDSVDADNTMLILTGSGDDTVHITAAGVSPLDDLESMGNGDLYNPAYTGRFSTADVRFGTGNDSVAVSGGVRLVLHGGDGYAAATGGLAADTFYGARGGGSFTGGAGADWYVLGQGCGHITVEDFASRQDRLHFIGTTPSDVSMRVTAEHGVSGLLVTYGDAGESVFLARVTSLAVSDLVFG